MKGNKIAQLVNATEIVNEKDVTINRFQIDSRKVKRKDCYIALIGKTKDGHDYINQAIQNGAGMIICSTLPEKLSRKISYLLVEDTNVALLNLGTYIRSLYSIPLIAITGSVGKTTTKELLYQVLKRKYQVLKSPKNYNNRIGVPLTLLDCKESDQLIIMEMGMNHLGEIQELSQVCQPDVSIITKIGTSHIGFLKGQKNIYRAKLEIMDGMKDGYVLVNGNDAYLKHLSSNTLEVIKVGKKETIYFSHVKLYAHITYAWLHINDQIYPISFQIPGSKVLDIILLVIQTGLLFQIPIEDIIDAIAHYEGTKERLEFLPLPNQVTLIDDSYNASLESLENDLSILNVVEGNKLLIFGDILELGTYSKKIHRKALKQIKKIKQLNVLLVGEELGKVKRKLKHGKWFSNVAELNDYLDMMELKDMTILVKGSHGVHLNQVVEHIKKSLF